MAQDIFYAKLDEMVETGRGNVNIWHVGGSHVQAAYFPNRIMNLLDSLTLRGDRGFLFPYKLAGTNYDKSYTMTATGEWEAPILTQSSTLRRPRYGVTGYGARTASPDASVSFRLNATGDSLWCCESLRVLGYGSSERAYPYIICLADTLRFDFEPLASVGDDIYQVLFHIESSDPLDDKYLESGLSFKGAKASVAWSHSPDGLQHTALINGIHS